MPSEIRSVSDLGMIGPPMNASIRQPIDGLNAGSLITRRLSEVEAIPVSWLWPRRFPRGKVSIIAGDPGLGKSQITSSIAAIVTTGGFWPVTQEAADIGSVLFLSAEDDAADTLRPRLEVAGAELKRVQVIDAVASREGGLGKRCFSLQSDLPGLSEKLTEIGNVAAVFIDPISAYLGEADSHKNAEIRSLLTPLSELAAHHNTAIIGVSHMSKADHRRAMMGVSGSIAFTAHARAVFLVASDPDDRSRRFLLPMKSNLAPDMTGLEFHIEGASAPSSLGPVETSRVVWHSETVATTADELVAAEAGPRRGSALAEASAWLREVLAKGPTPSADLYNRAEAEGFSKRTLKRAAKNIGIKPTKDGMDGPWFSCLPKSANAPEECQSGSGTLQ